MFPLSDMRFSQQCPSRMTRCIPVGVRESFRGTWRIHKQQKANNNLSHSYLSGCLWALHFNPDSKQTRVNTYQTVRPHIRQDRTLHSLCCLKAIWKQHFKFSLQADLQPADCSTAGPGSQLMKHSHLWYTKHFGRHVTETWHMQDACRQSPDILAPAMIPVTPLNSTPNTVAKSTSLPSDE